MSNLLFDSHPLVVVPELAVAIGLNDAIILQQVHYWLQINMRDGRNYHDGHYWTYMSYPKWQEQFPFWGVDTIKRTITRLEKAGFLVVGNFNRKFGDRTKWYRIDYRILGELSDSKLVSGNGRCNMPLSMSAKCTDAETVDERTISPEEINDLKELKRAQNIGKMEEENKEGIAWFRPGWKVYN